MKILKIKDIRTYEEDENGNWKAIRGSGSEHICDRCSKSHEVHVTIENQGTQYTVGTGCAMKDGILTESQNKAGTSCAKTIAKLEAQICKVKTTIDEYDKARAEIEGMERPGITEHEDILKRKTWKTYKMDGAMACSDSGLDEYHTSLLEREWIKRELTKRHLRYRPSNLDDLEKRLLRAEKKMAQIINE